jgi:4-hydroxy-tetrahydrodipicolinate reductase
MGRRITACCADDPGVEVVGGLETDGNPLIGQDIGEIAGTGKLSACIASDPKDAADAADVVIDFTFHEATINNLPAIVKMKKALVIGTTGFSKDELDRIIACSEKIPILMAPNMSLGVNLLFKLAGQVAAALGDGYDIEIVEAHHNQKQDAPSGTAKRIAENIADAVNRNLDQVAVHGRQGIVGARKPEEIGVHAVRGGDIVGDHTILYAGPGERIELKHQAHSRDTFARGAIKAAKFVAKQQPGLYGMDDVLGL